MDEKLILHLLKSVDQESEPRKSAKPRKHRQIEIATERLMALTVPLPTHQEFSGRRPRERVRPTTKISRTSFYRHEQQVKSAQARRNRIPRATLYVVGTILLFVLVFALVALLRHFGADSRFEV